jgi:multiple sugar transport system substrate-binding protein
MTGFVVASTPDAAQLGNTWISEFAALRALEPLDERVRASPSMPVDSFPPGIWDTNVIDGTAYGIPWYVDTRVLFYRTDLLARAGYTEMPQSWEEWTRALAAVKALGAGTRESYAVLLPANEWNQPMIFGLQAGSTLLADDATRGAFSSPEFRRAFDFYVDLFRSGLAPPVTNSEIANIYQEFERGHFAMFVTGPWNLGEMRRRLSPEMQGAWSTAPLPGPSGESTGVSMAGGSSLVLFRRSEVKDAAWAWIEYLSRPDVQARFYRLTGDLPARREAWSDSTLANDPQALAFREQLERVVAWPKIPEWEQIAIRLQEQVERAVRGAAEPEVVLADLDRDVDRILEKRRWLRAKAGGS